MFRGKRWENVRRVGIISTIFTKLATRLAEPFRAIEGLKQGCGLSPALFKIYLNLHTLSRNGLGNRELNALTLLS